MTRLDSTYFNMILKLNQFTKVKDNHIYKLNRYIHLYVTGKAVNFFPLITFKLRFNTGLGFYFLVLVHHILDAINQLISHY